LDAFLTQTRQVNGVNLPDNVRAATIANIVNKEVSFDEVISTISGQLYCVYRSLRREDPGITLDWVKANLTKFEISDLSDLVFGLTGLSKLESGDTEDPLETQNSTSTGETFGVTFQGGIK